MIQRLEQTCWKCQSKQAVVIVYNDYIDTVIFYISITLKIFWKHFEISFSLKVLKGHFLPLFQILRKRFDRINGWTCAAPLTHLSNNPDLSHPVVIWLCRIFIYCENFYIHFYFFLILLHLGGIILMIGFLFIFLHSFNFAPRVECVTHLILASDLMSDR